MLRFRQMKSRLKFASVHGNFHNHLNQEHRLEALAERQILMA